MAFSGDLEHLSIVDVIQLLHTTRKTGTLKVQGRKGEMSIAFSNGYLVGASHYAKGAMIGSILLEAKVIDAETLHKALEIQQQAGSNRKPLVATLLENGLANQDAAYRCLEALIELTIVEILTWKKGAFALQVDEMQYSDEFRYFPNKLDDVLTLPTEHVLMDALRIFDEKMRDGLLQMEDDQPETLPPPEEILDSLTMLSADDLGLADLSAVKYRPPAVHEALKDHGNPNQQPPDFNTILKNATASLQHINSLPEAACILLETVAALFPRSLILVAWETELVAERGIGVTAPREAGPGAVLGFKIPLSCGSLFRFIIDKGLLFYGKSDDEALRQHLYPVIGTPKDPNLLLLPLKLGKRVIALIYADFGDQPAADINTAKLESCAEHAGMVVESVLLRKQQPAKAA